MDINLKAKQGLKILVFGDLHGQYFSMPAVLMATKLAAAFDPNIVVNNGDGVDAEAVSNFQSSLIQIGSLQYDLDKFVEAQTILNTGAPNADKFYIAGSNHDDRIRKVVEKAALGLSTLKALQLDELLQLNTLGMTLADTVVIGEGINAVEVQHGNRALKAPGASVLAMLRENLAYSHSLCIGHSHRLAYAHQHAGSRGSIFGCEVGMLCDASGMRYMKGKNQLNWQHGILFITFAGKPLRPYPELIAINVDGAHASASFRGKIYNV